VDLDATAQLSGPFAKDRLKVERAEAHAAEPVLFQPLDQRARLDVRSADKFKRARRAPPFRQIGPLYEAAARIDGGGLQRRHIGRRVYPRQAGPVKPHGTPPAPHPNDLQSASDMELFVHQQRELPCGHAVPDSQRVEANKRDITRIQDISLNCNAVNGVGPVEEHHTLPIPG